jgi:hypothetical protein
VSFPTLNQSLAWLYLVAGPAGAFNDITIGTNRGFVCTANSSAAAFTARKGWDPVTGESFSLPAAAVASSDNYNRLRDAELDEAAQGGGVELNMNLAPCKGAICVRSCPTDFTNACCWGCRRFRMK